MKINLICTVGLPGAGKGLFVKAAKKLGMKYFIMGDVIREGAKRRYGDANPYTTGKYMKEIRDTSGREAVAKLISKRIIESEVVYNEDEYVLIDGLRCVEELEYFKKEFSKVILIAVLADLEVRYRRIITRRRIDDIKSIRDFLDREMREREVGVPEVIREADYYFVNNYENEEEALNSAVKLLLDIIRR